MSHIETAKEMRRIKMIEVAREVEERLSPELRLKNGLSEMPNSYEEVGYGRIMANLVESSFFDADSVIEILEWIHEGAAQARNHEVIEDIYE